MKTVVGLFENRADAERSMGEFVRRGWPVGQIGLMSRAGTDENVESSGMRLVDFPDLGRVAANGPMLRFVQPAEPQRNGHGLFGALLRWGMPRADAERYVQGIRGGRTLEVVQVEDEGAADAFALMRKLSISDGPELEKDTIVIPVIREEMQVGKREYDSGGIRVTTHVTAKPVEKTVMVREEHVEIRRKVVDRPLDGADEAAYRDRAFDLASYSEEPLLVKMARVVEEVHIHKDVTERTERVHDTLRHTDVQVSELAAEVAFDPATYYEHFKTNYDAKRYNFETFAPAYRFGEDLHRAGPRTEWTSVEQRAKPMWEAKNPGTWDHYRTAIRAGFDRLRAKVKREV